MSINSDKSKVYEFFDMMNIPYSIIDHPPLFSEADSLKHRVEIDGMIFKNLFLRNKSKSRYYLLSLPLNKKADLLTLAKTLGESRLSFGSETDLWDKLRIKPGAVSPLNIIEAGSTDVILLIDDSYASFEKIGVHPNDNTATILFDPMDLPRILDYYSVETRFVQLS